MKDTMILKDGTAVELEAGSCIKQSRNVKDMGETDRGESGRSENSERSRIDSWNL